LSQAECAGNPVTFSVVAVGSTPLRYQWQLNNNNIGENCSTYYIPSVAVSDAGNYTVLVTDSCGSITSSSATLTVFLTPPSPPTGLIAAPGNAQVVLSWSASSGVTSYNVKRSTTSGDPNPTLVGNPTGTTFTDTGLANDTTYYYVVSAINGCGEGTNSKQASATPQEVNPSGGTFSGSVFSFNINGDTNTSWTVYSSTDLKNWTPVGSVTLDGTGNSSYNDANVNGVGYRFYKLSNGTYCSQAYGFERTTVEPGTETWIANQLEEPVNTLNGLLNFGPNTGIQIQKWNGGGFDVYTWNGSQWSPNGNATLSPGEGAKIITPTTASLVTVTFVGLVPEGQLTIPLPDSTTDFVSSMVPQAGGLQSVLGLNLADGDVVTLRRNNNCVTYMADSASPTGWDDNGGSPGFPEPVVTVGEAVLISPSDNETWTQSFPASH
jgi:hypothetical protein